MLATNVSSKHNKLLNKLHNDLFISYNKDIRPTAGNGFI